MADEACVVRRRVLVSGLVQGVWFRDSCRQEAERLGVAGTVQNLPDGRVLGDFEGLRPTVEALIDWCHHGPPRARVDQVEVTEETPDGRIGFNVAG